MFSHWSSPLLLRFCLFLFCTFMFLQLCVSVFIGSCSAPFQSFSGSSPLSLSACCCSRYSFLPSSAFFLVLRLLLLFPLSPGFPHAAASSAPSSLSPLLPLEASPAASYYSAMAPFIHFCGFSGGGSSDFYSALPCGFCYFSCPVFPRIRHFSLLCFLGQLALSLSPPLCASLRFSSLRLRFLLCCYTWLSLSLYCFLLSLRHSDLRFPSRRGLPLGRVRVCWGFSLSQFSGLLPVLVSLSLGLRSVPLLLRVSGSSSDVIAFLDGPSFLWCSIWLWCPVPFLCLFPCHYPS